MKTSFVVFAAALVTLCFASTTFADAPAPVRSNASKVVSNSSSGTIKTAAPRMLTVAPDIILRVKPQEVAEGRMAFFDLTFNGMPTPTVVVYHNAIRLNYASGKYWLSCENGKCTLLIFNVVPKDAGLYTFEVINAGGTAMTSAMLTVTEPK